MTNIILLIIFVSLVFLTTSLALGIVVVNNKGHNLLWSGILCFFLPIIGQIIIALRPISDKHLVESMYERKLIDENEFNETMEHLAKK